MQTRQWKFKGLSPATLDDHYSVGPDGKEFLKHVRVDLQPGKTFEAPADWEPRHYTYELEVGENGLPTGKVIPTPQPHPLFEEVKAGGPPQGDQKGAEK